MAKIKQKEEVTVEEVLVAKEPIFVTEADYFKAMSELRDKMGVEITPTKHIVRKRKNYAGQRVRGQKVQ